MPLVVQGTDPAGNTGSRTVTVYVDASPHVAWRAQVDGTILDVSGTRTLYTDALTGILTIADSANGSTTPLPGEIQARGLARLPHAAGAIYPAAVGASMSGVTAPCSSWPIPADSSWSCVALGPLTGRLRP